MVQILANYPSQTNCIKDKENLNMILTASKIFKETVLFGPDEPSASLKDTLGKESIVKKPMKSSIDESAEEQKYAEESSISSKYEELEEDDLTDSFSDKTIFRAFKTWPMSI